MIINNLILCRVKLFVNPKMSWDGVKKKQKRKSIKVIENNVTKKWKLKKRNGNEMEKNKMSRYL